MKTDKVKYILEVCERFKVSIESGQKFKYNKNNEDRISFYEFHFEIHINRGYEADDWYEIYYSQVKSIEVLE